MHQILYYILLTFEFVFIMTVFFYVASLLYSSIMGSPYVPTRKNELDYILQAAKLKKGDYLLEIGCGDGRFLRKAAQKYGVVGMGVDINRFVLAMARFKTKHQRIDNIEFKAQNIFDTDFGRADAIYIFLMPDFIKKLKGKMERECKRGTLIISHGFRVEGWEARQIRVLAHLPFPTYFYKV